MAALRGAGCSRFASKATGNLEEAEMGKTRARQKSWRYTNAVTWRGEKEGVLTSEGKTDLEVATPSEFGGPQGIWAPEDLLVAAVNSCIMTTFLYFVDKFSVDFLSYNSEVEGEVHFQEGKLVFSSITVRPVISVKGTSAREDALQAIRKSEKYCLISCSLKLKVEVVPEIKTAKM